MTASQLASLYQAWTEADRRYRRRPSPAGLRMAHEAEAAYLAARDYHRGQSLEEVSARASLVPTEYTDPRTVDLFPEARDARMIGSRCDSIRATIDLFNGSVS